MIRKITLLLFIVALVNCSSDPSENQNSDTLSAADDSLSQALVQSFGRSDSSQGQTIYVPVYSHIYQQNQQKTFNLTATLSIRNTDLKRSFTLTKVLYYDSNGRLVKNYLDQAETIEPLASTFFVVEEDDLRGGVGANFIVQWKSNQPLLPPIVEAVMISTSQQQGISFVSHGRVLQNQSGDSLRSE